MIYYMVYLMMLSVAQTTQCRMTGYYGVMSFENMEKVVMAKFMVRCQYLTGGTERKHGKPQNSQPLD
jgi:hypothetical protein